MESTSSSRTEASPPCRQVAVRVVGAGALVDTLVPSLQRHGHPVAVQPDTTPARAQATLHGSSPVQ
jgi:hypothetical protein